MLAEQTELILSPYTELYNIVVPQTHKLRILKENIDFSFIRNEVKEKYSAKMGRYAEVPSECSSICSSSAFMACLTEAW